MYDDNDPHYDPKDEQIIAMDYQGNVFYWMWLIITIIYNLYL